MFNDKNRIKQIFLNLIGNALKYTEKGSISIIVKKKLVRKSIIYSICVKDTGSGIPNQIKGKLF